MKPELDIKHINHRLETLPHTLEDNHYESVMELLQAYNSIVGPVRMVISHYGTRRDSPVYVGHSEYYNADDVIKKMTQVQSDDFNMKGTLFAGGKGVSVSDMFLGSVAETVERLTGAYAYFLIQKNIVYGSYKSLTGDGLHCIHPDQMPLFADEQYNEGNFPFTPFTEDSYLGWIKGKRLISTEEIYVPAQMIMMLYLPHSNESGIGYATSGGLAYHISKEEAVYHGVCELIERDAVNIRWACAVPPETFEIDQSGLCSVELRRVFDALANLPLKFRFYCHTMDIKEIPVVTTVAIADWSDKYAYMPGGGADCNVEKAILKAVTEFAQAERILRMPLFSREYGKDRRTLDVLDIQPDASIREIDIFFKVVVYYGYKENLQKLEWYLNSSKEAVSLTHFPTALISAPLERYNHLTDILKKYRLDPIIFDFTPSYCKRTNLIKVFIPELTQPFLASYPYLGHPRYCNLPHEMGIFDRTLNYNDFVKDPLPYP